MIIPLLMSLYTTNDIHTESLELLREEEELLRYREEQERLDEEMARSLQDQYNAELEVVERGQEISQKEGDDRPITLDTNGNVVTDEEFARKLQEGE